MNRVFQLSRELLAEDAPAEETKLVPESISQSVGEPMGDDSSDEAHSDNESDYQDDQLVDESDLATFNLFLKNTASVSHSVMAKLSASNEPASKLNPRVVEVYSK
jgi:hypothetical protein